MYIVDNKFILIHFPKTAGHTIQMSIKCSRVGRKMRHPGIKQLPNEYRKYPIIGFIRNPYDFYVSFYFFFRNMINPLHPRNRLFRKYFHKSEYINLHGDFETIKQDFNIHLNLLLTRGHEHDINIDDKSVGLISRLYQDMYDSTVTVFKYEEMDVFNEYLQSFDINPMNEQRINKTTHLHYSRYYTKESIELVQKYDANILNKYDYTFLNV